MTSPQKATDFPGDLGGYLDAYKQQPDLTPRLDDLAQTELTQALINEIVLWKVNRYVSINQGLLQRIESLRLVNAGEHRKAESVLVELLEVHGVDLAMASTILRFRNPSAFQIIDRRAYRSLYGTEYPLNTKSSAQWKVQLYFTYLDDLAALCRNRDLNFEMVDRILYEFDKDINGKLANRKNGG